jgi:hypothetical protein
VFPAWWDVEEVFGDVAAEATTFLSPKLPLHPTFAFRTGAKKIWGPYPYFEAAYIGDAGTVRLGRDNRYAGDASAYGNAELRLGLGRATIVLPTDFGVFGLADVGRVFLEGENSDVWHSSFGGGIWLAPIARDYTVSAAVAAGDDDRRRLRPASPFERAQYGRSGRVHPRHGPRKRRDDRIAGGRQSDPRCSSSSPVLASPCCRGWWLPPRYLSIFLTLWLARRLAQQGPATLVPRLFAGSRSCSPSSGC